MRPALSFMRPGLMPGSPGFRGPDPIIAGIFARSFIAGRDGSLTILRNAPLVCPVDGLIKVATGASAVPLTSANACTATLSGGGLSLPMMGVFGARTNLLTRSDGGLGGVSASNGGTVQSISTPYGPGYRRTVNGPNQFTSFGSYTVTAQPYTARVWARLASGPSRIMQVVLNDPPNMFISATVDSTWRLLTGTVTPGAGTYDFRIDRAPSTGDVLEFANPQLEAAAFPSPYIPTAGSTVTRDADDVRWTMPAALSASAGEVWAVEIPYLWSAGNGIAHPSGVSARVWEENSGAGTGIWRNSSDNSRKIDAGGGQLASSTALADASGVARVLSQYWDASKLSLYQGAIEAAADTTLAAPWSAGSIIRLGDTPSGGSSWSGLVGLIYTPGGLTAQERTALAAAFGGRVIRFVA